MAKTDGDININARINTDKISKDLDGLKGKITSATGGNILKSVVGLGAAFATVTTAVKAANKVISETSEAYRVQKKAEVQLEQAARNNPYLNAKNVANLKNYASELQNIGTIGDETILPLMAQLATAGRNEAEIQNILKAALDVSASGMMSLDSAVTQLNATYSGNVGLLGRQIGELKNLTKEELESGKAVEIIGQKFNGMAKEVAEATGTSEQLKNAWGDLKEEIGSGFEKSMSPMRKFFTQLINGWTDAAKAKRLYDEAKAQNEAGNGNIETLETQIKGEEAKLKELEKAYNRARDIIGLTNKEIQKTDEYTSFVFENPGSTDPISDFINKQIEIRDNYIKQQKELNALKAQLSTAEAQERARADAAEAAAKAAENAAEAEKKRNEVNKYINENRAALDLEIEKLKLEAQLRGENVDEQAILNAYIKSYIDLVTGSDLIDENNPYSKERLKELEDYAKGIKTAELNLEELNEQIKEFLGKGDNSGNLSDTIKNTIDALKKERDALEENSDAWKDHNEQIKNLEELLDEVMIQEIYNFTDKLASAVSDYVSRFADIVSTVTDTVKENNEAQTQKELTELSKQYTDGLISYEEYCEKKGEINKKAKEEEYKINMWSWTAQMLQAAANVASGIASCLAETGIPTALKFVNMALVGAAGAAQIGALAAAKPQKPSFYARGGIVGGSAGGTVDGVSARLTPGEMVLNASQQANLWRMANSGAGGSVVNMPINIENNAANDVNANASVTAHGVKITIDKIINSSMLEGVYTNSMEQASAVSRGVNIL